MSAARAEFTNVRKYIIPSSLPLITTPPHAWDAWAYVGCRVHKRGRLLIVAGANIGSGRQESLCNLHFASLELGQVRHTADGMHFVASVGGKEGGGQTSGTSMPFHHFSAEGYEVVSSTSDAHLQPAMHT